MIKLLLWINTKYKEFNFILNFVKTFILEETIRSYFYKSKFEFAFLYYLRVN